MKLMLALGLVLTAFTIQGAFAQTAGRSIYIPALDLDSPTSIDSEVVQLLLKKGYQMAENALSA